MTTGGQDGAVLVFRGVCDASGALALPGGRIATIDDEKAPMIRLYDAAGGEPLAALALPGVGDPGPDGKGIEPDFEAAARMGDWTLWIGSHGRDNDGRARPERGVLLAIPWTDLLAGRVSPGSMRTIRSLPRALRDWGGAPPGWAEAFGPEDAGIGPAPERGGVSIEAMAWHPGRGELLLGFRSPVPDGLAVVAPLRNAPAVLDGAVPDLGPAIRLDLGGRGLRDMAWSEPHGAMLLIAGSAGTEADFALHRWGERAPVAVPWPRPLPEGFHPEAILPLSPGEVLLLSDDGDRPASARAEDCRKDKFRGGACSCKNIRNGLAATHKAFRGMRMPFPP